MTYGSLETCPSACWWNSHYGVCLLRGMVYDGTTCGDAGPCGDPDNTDSSLPFVPGPDVDTKTTVTFTNTATGASDSHIDSCGDANTLYEGLCFTSSVSGVLTGSFVIVNCDSGCLDGVCAGATPTTCADCMTYDEGTCPAECWWDSSNDPGTGGDTPGDGGVCLLDDMIWDDGACVACISLGGTCDVDSNCCSYPDLYCLGATASSSGICTETWDPCGPPVWTDPDSISSPHVCCPNVLHGYPGVPWDDWLPLQIYN